MPGLSRTTRTRVVCRDGIAFQVPLSNHSSYRYSVHSAGDGVSWGIVETLDVDQAHGLDFRQLNHIAIGVRKRVNKEHGAFGDNTAGGEHLPGGSRVLGIVETTADLTKGAGDASIDVTAGRFIGRGLVYDQTNNALWCWTNSDGTTSNNPYQVRFHPDRAWAGGDVTWAGAHEFDASVDVSSAFYVDGSAEVREKFHCYTTAEFDGTLTSFGGTAGIGLFYDPTSYTGQESIKLPNNLILKFGSVALAGGGTQAVTYGTAFPNAVIAVFASQGTNVQGYVMRGIATSTAVITVVNGSSAASTVYWLAIGR